MPNLRVVRPETRDEQIEALVSHMLHNPEACREVATEIVDRTGTLTWAAGEIQRLRDLLDASNR